MTIKHHITTLVCAATLVSGASLASAQNLQLHYDFNNITDNTVKDISGNGRDGIIVRTAVDQPSGVGTSGLAGDYAFNNTNSSMGGEGGSLRVDDVNLGVLSSFSITMWYKTKAGESAGNSARLFNNSNQLLAITNSGDITFNSDGASVIATGGSGSSIITQQNTWVFVALTFDGTLDSNQLKLYIGDSGTPVALIAQSDLLSPQMDWSNPILSFGSNTGSNGSRALSAYFDNIRFYGQGTGAGSALSLEDLNSIRTRDLTSVPEPSTYGLLAGLLSLGLVVVARRRR